MSDDQYIQGNADNPVLVPVELKDHSTDPKLTEEIRLKKKVSVKGRGRPKKIESRVWRCSTCQEFFDDSNVMKIGAGENRHAIFCPTCQKSLGFLQPDVDKIVDSLIKNNPAR